MYQALYRKWRPKTFDEVAGQEHITVTLKNQVRTDRLSHAYLFTGTRGTGKTTCARILARAVNCENPVDGNPCNACRVCQGIEDGSILDVVEIDAASNSSVDNVRQLRDEAVFSPAEAKKRVYIIDEVHMLSASAFNALLKILEEPPEHLMFILATTELNKVLPTVLSRCQRYAFKRIETQALVDRLTYVSEREGLGLTPEAASLIAGLSEGGLRDALSMLDQCAGRDRIDTETVYAALGLAGRRETAELLRKIGVHDTAGALEQFQRLWQEGKNPTSVLGELSDLFRDLLLRAVAPKNGRDLGSGGYDGETLRSFEGLFPREALIAGVERIQEALRDMRTGQARIACELCLIALCEPGLNDSISALRQRVAELERRLQSGDIPIPHRASAPAVSVKAAAAPVPSPAVKAAETRAAAAKGTVSPPEEEPDLPPWEEIPPPEANDMPGWEDAPSPSPLPEETLLPTDGVIPARVPVPTETVSRESPLPPSPEAAPPAASNAAEGETLWRLLLARASEILPGGLSAMLGDETQVGYSYRDGKLNIGAANFLALNMLDRPDVIQRVAGLASELAGHPVAVTVTDGLEEVSPPVPPAAPTEDVLEKLNALGKYPVVHFK